MKTHSYESILVLQKSIQQAARRMARVGLLFASFYLISMLALYIGTFVEGLAPVLADVSLYVVVVSVSLALLIILREPSA